MALDLTVPFSQTPRMSLDFTRLVVCVYVPEAMIHVFLHQVKVMQIFVL